MRTHLYKDPKQIKEIIIEIVCTACLSLMLLFLCNMLNTPYQTHKNIYAAKAFLSLAIYLLLIQRPRVLNLQTGLVTVLYLPIAMAYRFRFAESPDLFERDKIVVWIVYILLVILVDMYVYKKVTPLYRFNKPLLFIYGFMTVSMIFYRNNSTMPALLLLIFVVYLIPLTTTKWNRILNQIGNAWLISFLFIFIQSLRLNPTVSELGRWYGCFVNIGDFGLYLSCVFVILAFRIYKTIKKSGVRSVPLLLYVLAFLPLLWTILRVSTITMFIGIAFQFIMLFILFTRNGTYKETLLRLVTAFTVVFVICCIGLITMKTIVLYADKNYWYDMLHEGNALMKPLANIIMRAFYMFEEPITFSDCGVFHPDSIINSLDLFTSGRLSIIKLFSEQFSFTGTSSNGIQVGSYYAYNAHNTYVQAIFEYGYIAGGAYIIWLISITIIGVRKFLRTRKNNDLFFCLWMAMALGVFTGECARLYTPIMVMTLFLSYPALLDMPGPKKVAHK